MPRNLGLLILVLTVAFGAPAAFAQDRLGGIFAMGLARALGPHAPAEAPDEPLMREAEPQVASQSRGDASEADFAAVLSTNAMTSATAR